MTDPQDTVAPPDLVPPEGSSAKRSSFSAERLNRILAICAILISGASFYATYLQARSAEKQVQAMTLPLLQFRHGNYDQERQKIAISFVLENGGVGPAILKRVRFNYRGEEYPSVHDFFGACCGEEWALYQEKFEDVDQAREMGDYSSELLDVIIPGQSIYPFQVTDKTEANEAFWLELNKERWELDLEICYCSLLNECYVTDGKGVFESVRECSRS